MNKIKKIDLKKYLSQKAKVVDGLLKKYLPKDKSVISKAMRYSVMAGGKRLRPIFVMLGAETFGLDTKKIEPAVCAVEFLHTYSLIHDDLPAMDNDDLRRGKPTNHKKFGESAAILAGDALLTLPLFFLLNKLFFIEYIFPFDCKFVSQNQMMFFHYLQVFCPLLGIQIL